MKYIDERGDQQMIRVNAEGNKYQVTHETEFVALLSTVQVLNEQGLYFTRAWAYALTSLIQTFVCYLTQR